MLEIVWSRLARRRLEEIHDYIAKDKADAAQRFATRLVASIEVLKNYPLLGRRGSETDIRELVIGGTPYIVLYRVRSKRVFITTIWHGAQRRPRVAPKKRK